MAEAKKRKKDSWVFVKNPQTGEVTEHNREPSMLDTMKEAFMDSAQAARIDVARKKKNRERGY